MEDVRINLRKQQLEKITQQKARAQAQAQAQAHAQTQQKVETGPEVKMSDAAPESATSVTTTGPTSVSLVIVQPVPLHPPRTLYTHRYH